MNEEFDYKMQNNPIYCDRDKFMNETSVRLVVEGVAITSEDYADYRKPAGIMPKHCYGTDYGHKQNEKIQQNLKDYYLAQTVTKEELKDFFKDYCKDMRVILAQERKTTGLDADNNRQIILDTYEMFRMANLVMANLGNSVQSAINAVQKWIYDIDNPLPGQPAKSIEEQQEIMKERAFYEALFEKLQKLRYTCTMRIQIRRNYPIA